jgi:hypothetical protein
VVGFENPELQEAEAVNSTLIAAILTPILGPLVWWALNLPGKLASRLIWKYMPYGRLRTLLLRNGDPFKAVETPHDPSLPGYQKARRPQQPLGKPRR